MAITQTIEVPADRRITLEVPREIPTGATARVEFKVIPFPVKDENTASPTSSKLRLSKDELEDILQNAKTPYTDALTGILSDLGNITIEQIREERLAKYLK